MTQGSPHPNCFRLYFRRWLRRALPLPYRQLQKSRYYYPRFQHLLGLISGLRRGGRGDPHIVLGGWRSCINITHISGFRPLYRVLRELSLSESGSLSPLVFGGCAFPPVSLGPTGCRSARTKRGEAGLQCCFVLLIPTPEEYRVPRVNPLFQGSPHTNCFHLYFRRWLRRALRT